MVEKWLFFQLFFFCNKGQENVFYSILKRKTGFLGYKSKKFKKSKNGIFFRRGQPVVLVQNGHFSNCFFLGKFSQQSAFYHILNRKRKVFLAIKRRTSKKSKNWLFFQRGITHGFGPKMAIFPTFFVEAI